MPDDLVRARAPLHHFKQGDFEVTVLSDGFITIPADILISRGSTQEQDELFSRLGGHDRMLNPKANIPLIRKGSDLILIDIGSGEKYQPSDGQLNQHLELASINNASITKVVFSHAHPDHIWATLFPNGSLRYPNASYYVGAAEWDFWMDPDYRSHMPEVLHNFAEGARRDLGAIKERLVLLGSGDEIVHGLRAIDTAGHTPGHLSFEMSGGEGLLISVDVANNEIVSFEHPDWPFGYDTIPDLAIQTRKQLLDRAATDRIKLLGYHWSYPGVGYVERQGGAYVYKPTIE